MAPTTSTNSAFRLFDLPLELRELIYEHITHDLDPLPTDEKNTHDTAIRVQAAGCPYPELLRISRQFSSEYAKCVKRQSILEFVDWDDGSEIAINEPPFAACKHFTRAKMMLLAFCNDCLTQQPHGNGHDSAECAVEDNISQHLRVIKQLQPLIEHLTSFKIVLYICELPGTYYWPQDLPTGQFCGSLRLLTEAPNVTRLEVRCTPQSRNDHLVPTTYKDFESEAMLYGVWQKDVGWKSGKES